MFEPARGQSGAGANERRWRRVALALGLVPSLALLAAERYVFGSFAGFPLDDAWIHLQFARNLAAGEGLALHAGELVAGSTAPLWTALLALLALLPAPLELWTKLAGVAAQGASVALAFAIGSRLGLGTRRAALAAILVGWSDWLVWSAPSGMEVDFFVALSLFGLLRHLDERSDPGRPPVSFLILALAALARPEGLLLPILAVADSIFVARAGGGWVFDRKRLRRALTGLALAAIVLVPVALVFVAISGSPLPTTLGAKSSGPPALVPELRSLRVVLGLLFVSQPIATLLAAGGALELLRRSGTERDRGLLLPMWALGMPVAAAMLSSGREFLAGNFGRYFFPLLPAVVLLGLVALDGLRFARVRSVAVGRLSLPLGALLIAILILPAVGQTARASALYLQARANVEDSDGMAASWLAENVPADALLGLCDIGLVKYRLPNPIVDLAGIASPERRSFLRRMEREQGLAWPAALRLWLDERRPEYIVLYPSWFPLLDAEPSRFPVLHRIRIPNNVAMASDELVIYATPWTRTRGATQPRPRTSESESP